LETLEPLGADENAFRLDVRLSPAAIVDHVVESLGKEGAPSR
jgi:hypothetical protein